MLNMKKLNLYVLLIGFAISSVLGCTRDKGQLTTVRLALPGSNGASNKLGSLTSTEQVNIVVINVTGPGISNPVFYQWDGHRSNNAQPPAFFEVTVPRGESRLFQALVVMSDTSTGASKFYYGDLSKSVQAEESINIVASQVNSAAVSDGQIAGRFVNADGTGPSGSLRVYYSVAGKPKMLVARKEIFGGWFSTFALEGANLEYMLDDGQLLFGGPISVTSSSLLSISTNSVQNMRVQLPLHFYTEDSNATDRKAQAPSKIVLGWFGPGIAGKKLCFTNTDRAIPYAFTSASVANTNTIQWAPLASTPTSTQAAIESANGGVRGGWASNTTDSTQLCTASGDRFIDYISVDDANITHNDSLLAFRGPFQFQGTMNGSQILDATYASSTLTVAWKYLPQVYSTNTQKGVDGADIFSRILATAPSGGGGEDFRGSEDGVLCSQLSSLGFMNLASEPVNTTATDLAESVSISSLPSGFATAFDEGRVQLIVCPYRIGLSGKNYYSSAAVYYGQGGGGSSGGGGGMMMATALQWMSPQVTPPANIGNAVCTPLSVQGVNNGQPAMFPSSTLLTFSSDNGDTTVYVDSACSTPVSGVLNAYGNRHTVYVKRAGSGTANRNFTVVASGALTATSNISVMAYDIATPIPSIKVKAPTTIMAYKCYELTAETWHVDGSFAVPYSFTNTYYGFSWPATGFTYYDNYQGPCEGYTPSSLNIGGMYLSSQVYFRYTGNASTVSLIPTHANFSGDGINVLSALNIPVTQPGAASKIMIKMPSSIEQGRCEKVDFEITDTSSNLTPAPANLAITLNAGSGGQFYQYPGCSTPQTSPLAMNTGDLKKTLYYMNTTAVASTPVQLTLSATNSSPNLIGSFNISLTPATANQIVVVMPGEIFTDCSGRTGSPADFPYGATVGVQLYATKFNNCIDVNYNATLSSLTTYSSAVQTLPSPNTVTFANGVASFNLITAPSGQSSYTFNGAANSNYGSMYFNSSTAFLFSPANKFNIYMNQVTSLVPGACQIFAVIPEDNYGYAQIMPSTVSVNLSASGGVIYTDNACTNPFGGTFVADKYNKYYVFYYKNTNASDAQVITATASSFTSVNLAVSTLASGSVGPATKWQLLGYGGTTLASSHPCLPYISYLADAGGMFVSPGTSMNDVRMLANYLNGTTGYITDQFNCGYPTIDVTDVTLSSSIGYRASYATPASNPGTGHRITVRDNYLGTSVYTPAYIDLYRSD